MNVSTLVDRHEYAFSPGKSMTPQNQSFVVVRMPFIKIDFLHIVIMLLYARGLVFKYNYTRGAPCQWPCRLRWRLVALASWADLSTVTHFEPLPVAPLPSLAVGR